MDRDTCTTTWRARSSRTPVRGDRTVPLYGGWWPLNPRIAGSRLELSPWTLSVEGPRVELEEVVAVAEGAPKPVAPLVYGF
jgi:hypothetical protein